MIRIYTCLSLSIYIYCVYMCKCLYLYIHISELSVTHIKSPLFLEENSGVSNAGSYCGYVFLMGFFVADIQDGPTKKRHQALF